MLPICVFDGPTAKAVAAVFSLSGALVLLGADELVELDIDRCLSDTAHEVGEDVVGLLGQDNESADRSSFGTVGVVIESPSR